MSQLLTWARCDGSDHVLPGHRLLFLEAIVKPDSFDDGKLAVGDELVFCMSRCAARSQAARH
jgi:hypothetical protein